MVSKSVNGEESIDIYTGLNYDPSDQYVAGVQLYQFIYSRCYIC